MIYPKNTSLLDIVSGLPGIADVTSNLDIINDKESVRVFFHVVENNHKGLFLLTRCVDRRYWKYGHLWTIELSVGDTYNEHLPITYMLHSGDVLGDEAIEQSTDLIENINWHFTNSNFLEYYKIDENYFRKVFISKRRRSKIKELDKHGKKL